MWEMFALTHSSRQIHWWDDFCQWNRKKKVGRAWNWIRECDKHVVVCSITTFVSVNCWNEMRLVVLSKPKSARDGLFNVHLWPPAENRVAERSTDTRSFQPYPKTINFTQKMFCPELKISASRDLTKIRRGAKKHEEQTMISSHLV